MEIIGGTEVHAHSRPYMALIQYRNKLECGGTLIKDGWVLTAAHCRVDKTTKVILGAHSQSKSEVEKQTFTVKHHFQDNYDGSTHENDLMLLQLKGDMKNSPAVSAFPCLGAGDDVKAGTKCQAVGWGTTDLYRTKNSDVLMDVDVTIMSRRICNDENHYNNTPKITEDMLCAGNEKGTCIGDSGGPLICNGILSGITSFGPSPCSSRQYPGIFTRITAAYIKWIEKKTGTL
ncbi:granzyme A-like isoform X2 [Ambystoma mexicanum]